jgi:hypothetical protein
MNSNKTTASHQWKNADLCIDIRCECGELSHIDPYRYISDPPGKNPLFLCSCNRLFEISNAVVLTEVASGEWREDVYEDNDNSDRPAPSGGVNDTNNKRASEE